MMDLVGDPHHGVVEDPNSDREQIDGQDDADDVVDLNPVADDKRLFRHQKETAHEIRRGCLRRKADGDGENSGGAEQDAEVDSQLPEEGDHDKTHHAVEAQTLGQHRLLRVHPFLKRFSDDASHQPSNHESPGSG